jgi:hypothetical protein
MKLRDGIECDDTLLSEVCHRWQVEELRVFGSVLRDDFHVESDIDVLVTYRPGSKSSYFDMFGLRDDLQDLFGRTVDIGAELKPRIRERVLPTARTIYLHAATRQAPSDGVAQSELVDAET